MAREVSLKSDQFTTIEEFDEAMEFLDFKIRDIETRILEWQTRAAVENVYADREWWVRAKFALKTAKAQRSAMQNRKGVFSRSEKRRLHAAQNESRERAFIDVCREVLPKEQYAALWDRVDARFGAAAVAAQRETSE